MKSSLSLRIAKICRLSSLLIVSLLPLQIYLPIEKTIDQQAYSLFIAGVLAWVSILLQSHKSTLRYKKSVLIPLIIFLVFCLLSAVLISPMNYSFFGAPLVRIGFLAYIAITGIGIVVSEISFNQLIKFLFIEIAAIGLISFPLSLISIGSMDRVGGVFYQADILGIVCGLGILLGLQIYTDKLLNRVFVLPLVIYLALLLLASQSRAPIVGTFVLSVIWLLINVRTSIKYVVIAGSVLVILLTFLGSRQFAPRLFDTGFAIESTSYRLDLLTSALNSFSDKALLGYGPGNLADALDCRKLKTESLLETCQKGYFFDSSHNIYVDKFLASGIFAGLSYLFMVGAGIYWAFKKPKQIRIFGFCLLLISFYYLTNVTNILLEMIYLTLIIWAARIRPANRA